ncbi:MAG: hypothetical protein ACNA7Y_04640 [Gammaproteobacteria bacterium]
MQKLSTSAKQAIVEKALAKDGRTLTEIAKSHNIGLSTLGKWLGHYRKYGTIEKQSALTSNRDYSASEKFQHLMATASLDEAGLGVYCREQGIYSFQLTAWKEAFMTQKDIEKKQSNLAELKALRAENKQLKQEVRRKDSALAEATSLLILKKKQH